MASIIEGCNLYPYMELWRVAGKSEVNHKFGGILSIILVVIVIIVFVLKLIEVFSMNTITATSQTQITIDSPLTFLTTFQNDTTISPFMFAFDFQKTSNSNSFNISDFSFIGSYISQRYDPSNATYVQNSVKIELQKCTKSHFSMLAGAQQNFLSWNMNNWFCLPLYQKYEIGGHMSRDYKYLDIQIKCNSQQCLTSTNNSIIVNTYTLSTFINPYNNSQSSTPYILKHQTVFQSQSAVKSVINLDVNLLNTDRSLFPFAKTQTQLSLTANQAINTFSYFSRTPSTSLVIYRSGRTIKYDRSYLKLFDAFAYVGGIFNAFLTIFFFMRWYGCVVHELNFASEYFNIKQVREVGFFSFLYQSLYNLFLRLDCKLEWEEANKYHQLKKTVNRLLDIIYLQRRIQFLENAISVLFEKHQLTSLHLIHNLTREEADSNYQKFKFRNRLLLLLNQNFTETEQVQLQRQNQIFQDLIPNRETYKSLIIMPGSNECLESDRKIPIEQSGRKEIINKLKAQEITPKQEQRIKVTHFKTFPTLADIDNAPKIGQKSIELENTINRSEKTFEERQLENDNKQQAVGLVLQGLHEVKQLLDQAETEGGDMRSKRIYNKIDVQLKNFLKTITRNDNMSKISQLIK